MANIKIFGNILSYATPSASGDLVPKWYVDALADVPDKTTMTNIPSATFTPTYSGQVFYKNATTNVTLSPSVSNVTVSSGQLFEYYIVIKSNAKTVSFPTAWKWSGGSAPSTTTEGTYIIHVFTTDAKSKWRAELIGSYITPYNLKFTVQVTASDKSIYYTNWGTINNVAPYTVNWGDGTTTTNSTDTYLDHTYASAGTYQVKITSSNGELPLFMFYDDASKLLSVDYANVTWTGVDSMGYSGVFENCSNLTSIPSTIFSNNTNITSFARCFSGCSSLSSISADLFRTNTSATSFSYCFSGCSSLTSIPTDIFRYNTNVTTFNGCFSGCTSISIIPATTFTYNISATDFGGCFNGCTSVTSIPSTLFANKTASTMNYSRCFYGCTGLTSIPTTLFDGVKNNNYFADFSFCFYGCTGLTATGSVPYVIPVWEFDSSYDDYINGNQANSKVRSYTNCPAVLQEYIPFPYGGTITKIDSLHTYTKGDRVWETMYYNETRAYVQVYTYVSDTDRYGYDLSIQSLYDTSLFVPGYEVPSGVTASAKFYGYPAVGIFDLTFEDITINSISGGPTQWTYGTFNTKSDSGTIPSTQAGNAMMFYGCSWTLSGGVLTITFNGPMVSMYGSSYGISSGDQLVFTNFTETNGSPITATSTTATLS